VQALAARYPHAYWRHPDESDGTGAPFGPSGSAILSRWPIRKVRMLFAKGAPPAAQAAADEAKTAANAPAKVEAETDTEANAGIKGSLFPAMVALVDVPVGGSGGVCPVRFLNFHLRPPIHDDIPDAEAQKQLGTKVN